MDDFLFTSEFLEDALLQPGKYYLPMITNEINIPSRIQNIIKEECFSTFEEFQQRLCFIIEEHKSTYLFPNDICFFYPNIREVQARNIVTCQISGAIISRNESYFIERPLLENMNNKRVYTISGILKVSNGYEQYLPKTLKEFEIFISNFDLGKENDMGINFQELQINSGDNTLHLKELPKVKKLQSKGERKNL